MAAASSSFQVHPHRQCPSHLPNSEALQPNTPLLPTAESPLKPAKKRRVSKKPASPSASHSGKSARKDGEEAEKGYIHVRARRGQATDSHSLAERVRREKISERMKLLQSLVPGCHKVSGKALMLDEIINYVQSLQHQVELLSMKLASVNPLPFDFGVDMESFMMRPDQQELNFSMENNASGYQGTFPISTPLQQMLAADILPPGSSQSLWEEGDDEELMAAASDCIFF